MASRRLRREAQNLIKAPVQEHLEKVNYVYGIKNQWCMSDKPHFSLQFPRSFQRATQLDIRDKENEENEAAKPNQKIGSSTEGGTAMPAVKLTYEQNQRNTNSSATRTQVKVNSTVARAANSTNLNGLASLKRFGVKQ